MGLFTFSTGDRITVARINSVVYLLSGAAGGTDPILLINGSTLTMTLCDVLNGFKPPAAANAAPLTDGVLAYDTTAGTPTWGQAGTNRKAVSLDQAQTLSNKTIDASCTIEAGVNPDSPNYWILG